VATYAPDVAHAADAEDAAGAAASPVSVVRPASSPSARQRR
jgi:hypothetical protein